MKGFVPGAAGGEPRRFVAAGGRLFFVAEDPAHGAELWASDGTGAGTALVADLLPGAADSSPWPLGKVPGRLVFSTGDYWAVVGALAIYNGALIGEALRAGLAALPRGQREAALSLGMRHLQSKMLVEFPQAFRQMLPIIVAQLVVLLKDTSLGFIVGYPELLRTTMNNLSSFYGNRYLFPLWVVLGLIIPAALGGVLTWSWAGVLLGFLWGGPARVFLVHHVTWCVNSVCHLWGRRPYPEGDHSRNNFVLGVLAMGEGWHNNHHAFPTSARHGLRWWQIDVSYYVIRLLALVGLAWKVRLPAPAAVAVRS